MNYTLRSVPEQSLNNLDLGQGVTAVGRQDSSMKSNAHDDESRATLPKISGISSMTLTSIWTPKSPTPMKKQLTRSIAFLALLGGALLYTSIGCSRAPAVPPKEVVVQADDKMRFDITAFEVKPGQKVSVTLKNVGTTPKFSMGHNLVVFDRTVTPANVMKTLDEFSMEAAHDYVTPGSKEVLAHTKLLGPNETDTIVFTAPFVPGEYLYVCSFPGHYSQGTKGFMTVKP